MELRWYVVGDADVFVVAVVGVVAVVDVYQEEGVMEQKVFVLLRWAYSQGQYCYCCCFAAEYLQ